MRQELVRMLHRDPVRAIASSGKSRSFSVTMMLAWQETATRPCSIAPFGLMYGIVPDIGLKPDIRP